MLWNRFGADRSGQSNLTGFHHFHEDPAENLVNSLGSKTVTEIIADGREMRSIIQQAIALLYQLGVHEYDLIDAFKLTEEELLTLPQC